MSEIDSRYSESNIPPSRLQAFIALENFGLHRRPSQESLSAGYSLLKTIYSAHLLLVRDPAITAQDKKVLLQWSAPKLKTFVFVEVHDKNKFICTDMDTKSYKRNVEVLGTYDEVVEFLTGKVGS